MQTPIAFVGMLSAGFAGFYAWTWCVAVYARKRFSVRVREGAVDLAQTRVRTKDTTSSWEDNVIRYAQRVRHALDAGHGITARISVWPTNERAREQVQQTILLAGMGRSIDEEAYREARIRLTFVGGVLGCGLGLVLSIPLAVIGCIGGAVVGSRALPVALKRRVQSRARELERHLPEMLDVVALGMRSGLSFDRSIDLYVQHFDTCLAREFRLAQSQWSHGLARRDESLRALAATYDSALFARVVETIIRSLRFGASMAESLESASTLARDTYKARREEQVAKAPIKMMLPTGALILPAMLILVLGPVLLELMTDF